MIGGKLHDVSRRAARLDKTNPTHLSYTEEIFTVSLSHNILEATTRRLEAVNATMKPVELDGLGVTEGTAGGRLAKCAKRLSLSRAVQACEQKVMADRAQANLLKRVRISQPQ